jgi:cytochrome c biogenesis protein CcmG/thiol:disulfide interchange protein DsbE
MSETAENMTMLQRIWKDQHRRRIVIFCGVSLLNVGLIVLIVTQLLTPSSQSVSNPLINQPAPNFSLAILSPAGEKGKLSLSDFKGKPVVLNFWASWCDPCKEESPLLESAWKQAHAQGKDVVFLGIDFQDSNSQATAFLQHYGITYPIVIDAGSAATAYRITSLPDTFFINRQGIVVSSVLQQLTAHALSSNLQLITSS